MYSKLDCLCKIIVSKSPSSVLSEFLYHLIPPLCFLNKHPNQIYVL